MGEQPLLSVCAALRRFITQRYAVVAQQLRSETLVRNGCVIVNYAALRSGYAQDNLLIRRVHIEAGQS